MKKLKKLLQAVSLSVVLALSGCLSVSFQEPGNQSDQKQTAVQPAPASEVSISLSDIPAYSGQPYTVVHDNKPYFKDSDLTKKSYEYYSPLDDLGRCGPAVASIGKDLMPTKKRESIGMVKPSGWHTVKYDGIEGNYLYNRSHLIGYQLTGENANEKNLITGTRYMNADGMEPFESMTADYIKETNHHVLYRVTPLFKDNNLIAGGVLMEAESVEDQGEGITFCVYCYNVQPGITIDYSNGNSRKTGNTVTDTVKKSDPKTTVSSDVYIGNIHSKIFHHSWCTSVSKIKKKNQITFSTRKDAISMGYKPCKRCNP